MNARNAPQRLVNVVQLFRIRVAAAEARLKVMREQAREAKRRRKEAKRIAQSARRRFKQAKADLSELREALAGVEAKLFQAGGRALARKVRRTKRSKPAPVRKSPAANSPRPRRKQQRASASRRRRNTNTRAAASGPAMITPPSAAGDAGLPTS